MPIRFRCEGCDGVLSIARRKAGTLVHCPKCGKIVTVPVSDVDLASGDYEADDAPTEQMEEPATERVAVKERPVPKPSPRPPRPRPTKPEESALFERSDIDELLDKKVGPTGKPEEPKPAAYPAVGTAPAVPPTPTPDGLYITREAATVLAVLMFVLVALAFATGYLIGS